MVIPVLDARKDPMTDTLSRSRPGPANIRSCRVHAVPGSSDGHHGVLGIEVIVHELRRVADRSWRFRRSSVAGVCGGSGVPIAMRSMRRAAHRRGLHGVYGQDR
jgi:hypothetical protein